MVGLLKNLKNKYDLKIQYLCRINARENFTFKRAYKQEGLGIYFEYTAPGMPQQNGHVEWKFATPFNQVHSMLNGRKFNAYLQNSIWTKAANIAMLLENNLITPNRTLSPFPQFFGKGKRSTLSLMQKFGEICIATYRDNTHQTKWANKGTPGLWVGYAEDHPTSTY